MASTLPGVPIAASAFKTAFCTSGSASLSSSAPSDHTASW
jgi:hypothetical protein